MSFLRAARKLVLGETWALPLGIGLAVGLTALMRELAGPHGWWRAGGGFVLAAALVLALAVSLRRGA